MTELKGAIIDGIPIAQGYTIHQTHLENTSPLSLASDHDRRLGRRRLGNENEETLEVFLKWIKETYDPRLVYYPFSGWHISPRDIFGDDRVIHLSSDQCHSHLKDIEDGQRIMGDASWPPFGNGVFDAVILKDIPRERTEEEQFFDQLRSLVKSNGLFIVNAIGIEPIVKLCKQHLERLWVPRELKTSATRTNYLFVNADSRI